MVGTVAGCVMPAVAHGRAREMTMNAVSAAINSERVRGAITLVEAQSLLAEVRGKPLHEQWRIFYAARKLRGR